MLSSDFQIPSFGELKEGLPNKPEMTEEEIAEEYLSWLSSSNQLYEYLETTELDCSSLFVHFLDQNRLLIGTNNEDDVNFLNIYKMEKTDRYAPFKQIELEGETECNIAKSGKNFIAALCSTGTVQLFDENLNENFGAIKCHSSGAFALDVKNEQILTGSDNGEIFLFDLNSSAKRDLNGNKNLNKPLFHVNRDNRQITDLAFYNQNTFLASGSDGLLELFDIREGGNPSVPCKNLSNRDVNALHVPLEDGKFFYSGGDENRVLLWDVFNLKAPLHAFVGNESAILRMKNFENFLFSMSVDQIAVFDVNLIGKENLENDEILSPELVFSHRGHMYPLNDFDLLNLGGKSCAYENFRKQKFVVGSMDGDGVIMLWTPCNEIFNPAQVGDENEHKNLIDEERDLEEEEFEDEE